jgi:hypothetical protein
MRINISQLNLANVCQSFCFTITAITRAASTKAINMAPITDCEKINAGSELRVAVDGRPPKYAARKMLAKIAPMA